MFATLALVVLTQFPNAECKTSNGRAACGFDCTASNGTIECARTPWGRCVATNGQVFCGDPAPWAVRTGLDLSGLECLTTNGTADCGYDCTRTNGTVACARTPWGRCIATHGRVFCGDPAPWGVSGPDTPRVTCRATNGTAACGYDCVETNGTVACASTPWGRCVATNGRVFCGDPAPWSTSAGTPPVTCRTTNGTAACGYDCVVTHGTVACASTPWGRCVATNGRAFCSE